MPKIEAGLERSFKINGKPFKLDLYETFSNDNSLASTTAKVIIAPSVENFKLSVAVGTIDTSGDQWVDDTDTPFADLQAFYTYLETFFYKDSGGGGGGAVSGSGLGGAGIIGDPTTAGGLVTKDILFDFADTDNLSFEISFTGNANDPPPLPIDQERDAASVKIERNSSGLAQMVMQVTEWDVSSGTFLFYNKSSLFNQFFNGSGSVGFDLSASQFTVQDDINSKGPVGSADYSANAAADDLAYPQVGLVKDLAVDSVVLEVNILGDSGSASTDPFDSNGSTTPTWANSGILGGTLVPLVAPFDGTITNISGTIGKVKMNSVPGATNAVTVAIQFREDFWNGGGTTLGAEIALPLGADIPDTTILNEIVNANTQGRERSIDVSVAVSKGQIIGVTFEPKFSSTQAQQIANTYLAITIEKA